MKRHQKNRVRTTSSPKFLPAVVAGLALGCSFVSSAGVIGGDRTLRTFSSPSDATAEYMAIGPVEVIDIPSLSVTVLGQKFTIAATASARVLKSLRVGDLIAIEAVERGSDLIVQNLQVFSIPYVAGASPVYIKGVISAVDSSMGRVLIGTLWVDYTPLISNWSPAALTSGLLVEVFGSQPAPMGSVLATEIAVRGVIGGDLSTSGVIGGDLNGVIGGDTNGVIGGDLSTSGVIGGDS